jgi:predicted alpha/beta-fold hydrolase
VPCLVIHALDDFMVPVDEAYELLAAAVNNPMVEALIVPTGGHALYHMSSPSWVHKTLQAFFTYWAEFGPSGSDWTGPPTDSMDTFGNSNN